MKSRKHILFVLAMAFLMFTSTWAGAFAKDETEPAEEPTGVTATSDEVKADSDMSTTEVTTKMGKPTAELNGNVVTISWTAPEPVTIMAKEATEYTVTRYKNGSKDGTLHVATATQTTDTLTESGSYQYTVKSTNPILSESDKSEAVEYTKAETPTAPSNIEALSGYNMVRVRWTDSPDAEGYVIKKYDSQAAFYADQPSTVRKFAKDDPYFKRTGANKLTWDNVQGVTVGADYWYRVYAANNIGQSDEMLSAPLEISKGPVRPMYITIKLKTARTLTSQDRPKTRVTIPKNTTLTTTGYAAGCYYFTYKNGHKYRVSRTSAKNQKAYYNGKKGWNYTREEAELFVNQYGIGSKTNYLIWTSFYTQRLYVMQRSGGQWVCIADWDCSTGKASTPSPTGNKKLGGFKKRSYHGISYWNGFSGENSIHGKRPSYKLGLPQSHGCIRNANGNAKFVYYTVNKKKGTRVINY